MDEISSNLKETLQLIDEVMAERNASIELGEKLKRLKNNPDFIAVILDGYIATEEKKLFKILTDPSGASPYTEAQITKKLNSISDLKAYIGTEDFPGTIMVKADNAPGELLREEQYRKEVTTEYSKGRI
jgi:hypothetical protein